MFFQKISMFLKKLKKCSHFQKLFPFLKIVCIFGKKFEKWLSFFAFLSNVIILICFANLRKCLRLKQCQFFLQKNPFRKLSHLLKKCLHFYEICFLPCFFGKPGQKIFKQVIAPQPGPAQGNTTRCIRFLSHANYLPWKSLSATRCVKMSLQRTRTSEQPSGPTRVLVPFFRRFHADFYWFWELSRRFLNQFSLCCCFLYPFPRVFCFFSIFINSQVL